MCLEICDWLFNPLRWTPVVNTTYTTDYPDVIYRRPVVTTPIRPLYPVYVDTAPRRDFVVSRNPIRSTIISQRPVVHQQVHRQPPLAQGRVIPACGLNRPTDQARVIPGSGRYLRGR